MSTSAAEIDVLIPAFNVESTVVEAVASIQNQTVRNIRIIIVDDGSTDRTAELLAKIAADDSRVVVISQPNGGIVDALNRGLAHCTAPLLARHDADDLAYPERFEKQRQYLDQHPDCVAVGAIARHIDENNVPTGDMADMHSPDLADPFTAPSVEPYIVHPLLMVRLDAVKKIGGYRYAWHSEDVDLYWRLQDLGRLHNMRTVLADYRMHSASVSSKSILNGRIAALSAQLAALSERRRREGRPDLTFPRERLKEYQADRTLEAMVERASAEMTPDEKRYLEVAVAAKLIELIGYRPYRLDPSDREFIRTRIDRNIDLLRPSDAKWVRRRQVYLMADLLVAARLTDAFTVTPPKLYHRTAWHLGWGKVRKIGRQAMGLPAVPPVVKEPMDVDV